MIMQIMMESYLIIFISIYIFKLWCWLDAHLSSLFSDDKIVDWKQVRKNA